MHRVFVACLAGVLVCATSSSAFAQSTPPGAVATATPPAAGADHAGTTARSKVSQAITGAFANSAARSDATGIGDRTAPVCSTAPTPEARACRDLPGAVDRHAQPVSNDNHGNSTPCVDNAMARNCGNRPGATNP